jgi:hypothetical protein
MDQNRMMQQIGTIFSGFMTFFYLSVGIYLILTPNLLNVDVDKFLRLLVGITFIIYGIYRGYRTYVKVLEVFFTKDDDNTRNF